MTNKDLVRAAEARIDVEAIERRYAECEEASERRELQMKAMLLGINEIIKVGGLHYKMVVKTPELVDLISQFKLNGRSFSEDTVGGVTYGTVSKVKVKKRFGKPVKAIIFFSIERVDYVEEGVTEAKLDDIMSDDIMAFDF